MRQPATGSSHVVQNTRCVDDVEALGPVLEIEDVGLHELHVVQAELGRLPSGESQAREAEVDPGHPRILEPTRDFYQVFPRAAPGDQNVRCLDSVRRLDHSRRREPSQDIRHRTGFPIGRGRPTRIGLFLVLFADLLGDLVV